MAALLVLCSTATALVALPEVAAAAAPDVRRDVAWTNPDAAVTVEVLANDVDADGDSLTVSAVADPAHGTATVATSSSVRYTPDAGFSGTDVVTYTARQHWLHVDR